MRYAVRAALLLLVILALVYACLLWVNNRRVAQAGPAEIEQVLEKSTRWLDQHRERVLAQSNPMLWYMIQRAGDIGGDARLRGLFAEYRQRHIDPNPQSAWRPLFSPGTWSPVRYQDIASFPYYNQHFLYAITCDSELGSVPDIAQQNDPAFCDAYPWKPACVTHQLMGIRLMQRIDCGEAAQLEHTVDALQKRIVSQLTWDPRVVDVYLQRVLMLEESGAAQQIKPVWIRRIIDAQRSDGGWSSVQPLLPLGADRSLAFSARILSLATPRSNFHATAQGILLFTLMKHRETPK